MGSEKETVPEELGNFLLEINEPLEEIDKLLRENNASGKYRVSCDGNEHGVTYGSNISDTVNAAFKKLDAEGKLAGPNHKIYMIAVKYKTGIILDRHVQKATLQRYLAQLAQAQKPQ